jgi:hypothetical protein
LTGYGKRENLFVNGSGSGDEKARMQSMLLENTSTRSIFAKPSDCVVSLNHASLQLRSSENYK